MLIKSLFSHSVENSSINFAYSNLVSLSLYVIDSLNNLFFLFEKFVDEIIERLTDVACINVALRSFEIRIVKFIFDI